MDNVVANRKGVLLIANEDGTYSVEDADNRISTFSDVVSATRFWGSMVFQEMYS